MRIPRHILGTLATFVLVAVVVSRATAITLRYVPDRSLAESPIVVVAKWDGSPWVRNEDGVRSHIVVERVIRGDLEPGKHEIIPGYAIGWFKERPRVTSYASLQIPGADATKSNLWFLHRKRSSVKTDAIESLCLKSYRGVQPLVLEPYFNALAAERPAAHVGELLQSDNELVLRRTLELVAGQYPPWPYEPPRYFRPKNRERPLTEHRELVLALIQRTENVRVRRYALAVYAQLAGTDGLAFMREQLASDDPHMRGIAIGALLRLRMSGDADLMAKAAVDVEDPRLACGVIECLQSWNDLRAVPILIPFLQTDGLAYMHGNDLGIPAIRAQKALRVITRYDFPFDVAASQKAWATAGPIEDRAERNKYLARVLPNDPSPWEARVFERDGRAIIEVTNRSQLTFVLARSVPHISVRHPGGQFVTSGKSRDGENAFATLKPGEFLEFDLDLREYSLEELADRGATFGLCYMLNGNDVGVNAWLGKIIVRLNRG